ncbi:MAG: formylglycine-generating enzyme family protein [Candidatus Omnitrophica bacterium]|nr:formylglycine-generating enzyme family protein [Candidatus Omnitrophota bacterium]
MNPITRAIKFKNGSISTLLVAFGISLFITIPIFAGSKPANHSQRQEIDRPHLFTESETVTIVLPEFPEDARPIKLRRIQKGDFVMGAPETEMGRLGDSPQHEVEIEQDFFISETEITAAQWRAIMRGFPDEFVFRGNNYPMCSVSWFEIASSQGFLDELNSLEIGTFRLPNEEEWEYACRAGTETAFSFGSYDTTPDCSAWSLADKYMVWCANSKDGPNPVGSLLPNGFGLFDMHGNLYEWCENWYDHTWPRPNVGGQSHYPTQRRKAVRGGCWKLDAHFCRCASEMGYFPTLRSELIGFRIVLDPEPPD